MVEGPPLLASLTGALAIGLPAVVLALGNFLRDAPAEWARGALGAWTALAAMLVAGAAAPVIAPGLVVALAAGAFAALVIGGPWGLALAAGVSAVLLGLQATAETWPVHPLALPLLTAAAALAAARWRIRRR